MGGKIISNFNIIYCYYRGLLARSVITAQGASPTFTHVYASLVAIINTKFPQTGELIIKRLVIQFKKAFHRNDKKLNDCLSSVRFIAHLVNQQVRKMFSILILLSCPRLFMSCWHWNY